MKIAVPIWENRISPVLDTADRLALYEVSDGAVANCGEIRIGNISLQERARLIGENADTLVCAGLSRPLESYLTALDVSVLSWLMGEPERIIRMVAFGTDPGPEYRMPGCGGRRGFHCGRGKRSRHRHSGF